MRAAGGQPAERDRGPVLPRYDGQSLLNVPATVCAVLDAPGSDLAPPLVAAVLPRPMLDGVAAVLVLVVDGLGRWQLDGAVGAGDAPTLATLVERAQRGAQDVSLASITSVFPSSTIPALTTLGTGLAPAAHGLMGWTVYLDELGEVAELARWGPAAGRGSYQDEDRGGQDPVTFFGLGTLHQRLARGGVRPAVICPAAFRGSGLSTMTFQGAEFVGYHATSSLFVLAERLLEARGAGERLYLYAYWDTLDPVSHHHGPLGPEHGAEVAALDLALGRWLDRHRRRGDLLVLITADHGHVPSEAAGVVRLDQEPSVRGDLRAPPTGERRMAYLHARPGRLVPLRESCARQLGAVADALDPDDAFARGLFGPGPVSPAARRRVGDLILLARGDGQFIYPYSPRPRPAIFAGNHGALDPREMLVPLLALRL
jgi:Type I phosphodiesterase / nucleotide pyrophosphatase